MDSIPATELPMPLVPAVVDLREFPFPLYVDRLRRSTTWRLTARQNPKLGYYMINLWTASWREKPAASLADDDAELAEQAICSLKRWRFIRESVLAGWVKCCDGRIYHPFLAEQAIQAWPIQLRLWARIDRRLQIESGEWASIRRQVYERDNFTCRYCGGRGMPLECDHKIPLSRGGKTVLENLVTSCRRCNRSKGAKLITEWTK